MLEDFSELQLIVCVVTVLGGALALATAVYTVHLLFFVVFVC